MSPNKRSTGWQGRKDYWSAFRRMEYRAVDETLVIWDNIVSNVLCHVIFVKSQGLKHGSGLLSFDIYSLFVGVGGEVVSNYLIRWATSSIGWEFWNLFYLVEMNWF